MHTKIVIGVVAVFILAGAGAWFVAGPENSPINTTDSDKNIVAAQDSKPWIEVLSPKIIESKSDGTSRELKTGDELSIGSTVTTDTKGKAVIHFESGSLARLDANTVLTLEASSKSKSSFTTRLKLVSGRVWSKIFAVAGSENNWEVETSNAVAVVRGTAFSTELKNGITRIVGAENTVKVLPLDPATGTKIEDKEVQIEEKKYVDIGASDIQNIQTGGSLVVKSMSSAMLKDPWFSGNMKIDAEIKIDTNTSVPPANQTSPPSSPGTNPPSSSVSPPSSGYSSGSIKPSSLVIGAKSSLDKIMEGQSVQFVANLKMSDGTSQDVTSKVRWEVVGYIGSISATGLFKAVLDPSVAEYGQGPGAVVATWKNTDGTELSGKILFIVYGSAGNDGEAPPGS